LNELRKCFRNGLLRKVEPSQTKYLKSLKESDKWIEESTKNLESKAYSSAQLSIYLAYFHAARSVLFRDGVREKSHYCIGIYLESYVKEGLLEEDCYLLFDRMKTNRHSMQYSFETQPTKEEIVSGIRTANHFNKRMRRLLKETELMNFI
jgi:uncharacterized protein (UPF0332 family)